ncbi:MAG TPA: hypothetical protein PLB21_04790 [Actinomycetota bacterium]|nr:hypothetical protein [Actinomycetota bacterium]
MGSGSQTVRQQARQQVGQVHAARLKEFAEREKKLGTAAVEVVAALVARERAEQRAAVAIRAMLALGLNVPEVAQRCGISPQQTTRLKNAHRGDAKPNAEHAARSGQAPEASSVTP